MAILILNSAILLATIIYSVTGSLVHLGDVEGKAYYEEADEYLNWTEAHSYCAENGMRLAKIESTIQADFLASVVTEPEQYWVSSRENGTALKYSWTSQGVNLTYSVIWTDSGSADNENCAYVELWSMLGGFEFFHIPCSSSYPFTLCEGDSNSTANSLPKKRLEKPKKERHEGLHQNLNFTHLGDIENKSFYLHESARSVSWEQAYNSCQEGNMSLARIESDAQANFLSEKLEEETYWIGINNVDFFDRRRTYNLTGAYMQMDLAWATEGRVDPSLGCAGFYQERSTPLPTVMLMDCYEDNRNFLCHVNL